MFENVFHLSAYIPKWAQGAEQDAGKLIKGAKLQSLWISNFKLIADNATTVVRVQAEAAHKACLDNYASYKAAERGATKFLRETVDEVWLKDLKDADSFYMIGP